MTPPSAPVPRTASSASRTSLWVVPVGEFAGVARHVVDVAQAGLEHWELVVLCPEGALAQRLREIGTRVITGALGPAAGVRASVRTVRSAIAAVRPALVHGHLSYADVVCALATIGTGVKLVTTEHGIARDDEIYHRTPTRARMKALMHRLRLRRTDLILAVSRSTCEVMQAKWRPRREIVVIHNGVDPDEVNSRIGERVPGEADQGHRVLSLSRLSAEKGIAELLAAFAVFAQNVSPRPSLVIAGEGPDRALLTERAAELGVADVVSFPGFVDSGTAMAAADLVVQLSVWENCSYTLLDARAAELPVVATPVGGNPEIMPAECLVPADEPAAVAAAMISEVTGPRRPFTWLSRREMTDRISQEYDRVCP